MGLQGTQCTTTLPVEQTSQDGFHVFHWGRAPGKAGRPTGVALCASKRALPASSIREVWVPPESVRGRLGMVRFKTPRVDVAVVVGYAPCEPQCQKDQAGVNTFWRVLCGLLSRLPARCTPLLLLDANGKLGVRCDPLAGLTGLPDSHVGPCQPDRENYNGSQLASMLRLHGLSAINTFFNAGHTFFHNSGTFSSRIDYICCPVELRAATSKCEVWYRAGDALQLINTNSPRDHRPVVACLPLGLHFTGQPASRRVLWDHDALNRCVIYGERRHEFVSEVESKLWHLDPEHLACHHNPDVLYEALRGCVRDVAARFFTREITRLQKPSDTQRALQCRVQARRDLRAFRLFCTACPPLPWLPSVVAWLDGPSLQHMACVCHPCLGALRGHAKLARLQLACRLADKSVKRLCRRDRNRVRGQRVHELHFAWQARDFATCWKLSRLLSGRRLGPKRRLFSAPSACCGTDEWTSYLRRPGADGGCSAAPRDWQTVLQQRCDPLPCRLRACDLTNAAADLSSIGHLFRCCKLRKAPPSWSFPAGVWRMLFYPGRFATKQKVGLGASPPPVVAPSTRRCIFWLLVCIRARGCTPLVWHATSAFTIGKHNGKSGCAGQRLLHGLDSFSKRFFLHVWRQAGFQVNRPYAYGYAKGRRREHAIMQQSVLCHRLDLAGCSRCTDFFDAANAFASPSHAALLQFVQAASPDKWTTQILQQRLADATLFLQCADGQLVLGIGSGTLPGDSIACEWFLGVYHQAVDRFAILHVGPPLHVHCPWLCGIITDSGPSVQHALRAQAHLPVDVQNTEKQESLLRFAGRGSRQHMRAAYGLALPIPGKVVRLARYLGPRLQYNGALAEEQRLRLHAARAAYAILGGFWRSTRNNRWKGLVFNSMVIGALISGLCSFVLPKGMENALDSQAALLARKVLLGRACDRSHPQHFKSLTNAATLRMLQCHPPSSAVQVQRLRLWQQVVKHPERSVCLLGSMFGEPCWGHSKPNAGTQHKYVELLCADLCALAALTPLESYIGAVQSNPLVLFTDPDIRDAFLRADPAILLAARCSIAIPPPGYEPLPRADAVPEKPHVCRIIDPSSGLECGACFSTNQALVLHQVKSGRPEHGKRKLAYVLTVSNQCLLCRSFFASKWIAAKHLASSFERGICPARSGSVVVHEHLSLPPYQCVLCQLDFDDIVLAQDHLQRHLPPDLEVWL